VDKWVSRNARDPETGKYKAVRNTRRFFADLTTEGFIKSFDNEEPPELRNEKMTENIKKIMSAITNKKALAVSYGDYSDISVRACGENKKDAQGSLGKIWK